MSEGTPGWTVAALPVALAALTVLAAGFRSALAAAGEGRAEPWRAAGEPFRAAARLLLRSRRTTLAADRPLTLIGVVCLPVAALLAGIVVPLGAEPVVDMAAGVVWFNAMEVVAWAAVWLVGWGPNSVFSLVGGYRFIAQGLAYELPHMFALITAALGAGSLRVSAVADAQDGLWFAVWMPVAFLVYLLSALAMAFWGPMSHPLGADAAGGAAVELTGADRLVFAAGRYALLSVAAAMAVPLFLGGGSGPLLPAWSWVGVKTLVVLALLVWSGRALPVLRMDRFMQVAWVVLIPATLLQMLVVGIVVI